MEAKIGYPDQFRDYAQVGISARDFFGNVTRATRFENLRQLAKIGKPVDRSEWSEPVQSLDGSYNDLLNSMEFSAGILQPPLFDPRMDLAPGYGNTGGMMGHELIHGFDDNGRRFDARGVLRDWWAQQDEGQFVRRARCISDQYSQYIAVDDVHVNGRLTLGEDVADLAGLSLAYRAWRTVTAGTRFLPRDGLSGDQRFFVGYAQWACANVRPETARVWARNDPHSPSIYRVNGVVVNMPEFATAFQCKPGQPMAKSPAEICRVW
jgi:endothelin-converting enzyme/putative endopeptidase